MWQLLTGGVFTLLDHDGRLLVAETGHIGIGHRGMDVDIGIKAVVVVFLAASPSLLVSGIVRIS